MRTFMLVGFLATSMQSVAYGGQDPAQTILGDWARGDGKANVHIALCGSDLCATNIWVRSGDNDEHVGDVLVMSIKPVDPSHLGGTAYDPQRKLNLNLTVDVADKNLTTDGCVLAGIICNKMGWTRIEGRDEEAAK